jgi:hypothetical protein
MPSKASSYLPHFLILLGLALGLILLPTLVAAQQAGVEQVTQPTTAVATLLRSDAQGVLFELQTPPLAIDASGLVSVPGLRPASSAPGTPALPTYSTYIAVPPGAAVNIKVTARDMHNHRAEYVRPVPLIQLQGVEPIGDSSFPVAPETLRETQPLYQQDTAVYTQDAFYPIQSYALSEPMVARNLRLVQLDLYPVRYNPARQTLSQAALMQVEITFSGAQLNESQAAGDLATVQDNWRGQILNNPPQSWRLAPQTNINLDRLDAQVALPIGVDTYKIEVDQDGIYEISGSELADAGMNLSAVNVNTLQMMYRGQNVAFQFINDGGSNAFEPADKIRFYGWAFDGSRYEDMYVSANTYWLWAGGTTTPVQPINNGSGSGFQSVTEFPESITKWPHQSFFSGWGVNWAVSPNEATSWHWRMITANQQPKEFKVGTIELPDPVPGAAENVTMTTELTSRLSTLGGNSTHTYQVSAKLNDQLVQGSREWTNQANVNLTSKLSSSQLLQPGNADYPANAIKLIAGGDVAGDKTEQALLYMYLTRVTVDYTRRLKAVNNELQFGRPAAGAYEYLVSGFSSGSPADALVWDISNRLAPRRITLANEDIVNNGSDYTYKIRSNQAANGRFITTTTANLRSVKTLTQFTPIDLAPPGSGAQWLAISHNSLLPAAQQLAAYRADRSGLSTWVIDIEAITNQVGYGYSTPQAIREYLQGALATWQDMPQYVILFGDATTNPRGLPCLLEFDKSCPTSWDTEKPTLVPTDLLFVDRYSGLIPVDYTMSLLSGQDNLPDLAIGRVPAETLAEASRTVARIIKYEQNLDKASAARDHFLFVADNADGGGNFCFENAGIAADIPASIATTQLCLENREGGLPPTEEDTQKLRAAMFEQITNPGVSIMNYRGHGSITAWANPYILDTTMIDFWQNSEHPVVLISADCLDGYFATAYTEGLGETFIGLNGTRGTAAHWSSTGLGYTFEHTPLARGFYKAIFSERILPIGDAVNYSKIAYLGDGYDVSEAYAFTLLGDPAMETYPWTGPNYTSFANIPAIFTPK